MIGLGVEGGVEGATVAAGSIAVTAGVLVAGVLWLSFVSLSPPQAKARATNAARNTETGVPGAMDPRYRPGDVLCLIPEFINS